MSGANSPGISRLAGVIRDIAARQIPSDMLIDFGEIQADGSLMTNTFPLPIPKSDYIVCRRLSQEPRLAVGDRVVVAWVDNDAVVIDVILNADQALDEGES